MIDILIEDISLIEYTGTAPTIEIEISEGRGPPGPIGPPGPPSTLSVFAWSPPSPQNTWLIPHNLNTYPAVTITLPNGEIVMASPTYLDSNTISVAFAVPVTGTAYLR